MMNWLEDNALALLLSLEFLVIFVGLAAGVWREKRNESQGKK